MFRLPIVGDLVDPSRITQIRLHEGSRGLGGIELLPRVVVWLGNDSICIDCDSYQATYNVRETIAEACGVKRLPPLPVFQIRDEK